MIYTFYSYKGGVGRSMAAANIAKWYYLQGLRVVLVDWDLEAPGLEAFFFPPARRSDGGVGVRPEVEAVQSQLGVIDLLVDYKNRFPALEGLAAAATVKDARAVLDQALTCIEPKLYRIYPEKDATSEDSTAAGLWLLPAGWRGNGRFAAYGRTVQSFDWNRFYEAFQGEAYFEWLRDELNRYDVVIIDSRTGVTEMGGVCTRQLADAIVSFCAPNIQNLDGVAAMLASFRRDDVLERRGRPLDAVVVPTRLDNNEIDLRNEFERVFLGTMRELPLAFQRTHRTFWDLKIPYVPKYAYAERLTIGAPDRAEDLEEAYESLALHLALLAPEDSRLRRVVAPALRHTFSGLLPRVFVASPDPEAEPVVRELCQRLEAAGISVFNEPVNGAGPTETWNRLDALTEQIESLVLVITPDSLFDDRLVAQWRATRRHGGCVFFAHRGPLPPELPRWLQRLRVHRLSEDMDVLVRQLGRPCKATRVPFMAAPLPSEFVPRPDALDRLKRSLLGGSPGRVVLCGPPGSGKTLLARAACHDPDVLDAFEDGILWVTLQRSPGRAGPDAAESPSTAQPGAENGASPLAELRALYTALSGEELVARDRGEAAVALGKVLQGRRCLLVIDDAWEERELRSFMPDARECTYLITTRHAGLGSHIGADLVPIDRLEPAEAVQLLQRYLPGPAPDSTLLQRIAQRLGYSPLALQLAGVWLRQSSSSGAEAAQRLAARIDRAGIVAFDAPGSETTLAGSIELSLDTLPGSLHQTYLRLAGLEADRDIPLEEVRERWRLRSDQEAERIAEELAQRSLLHYDDQRRVLRLHPVLQAYLTDVHGSVRKGAAPALETGRTSYEKLQENPHVARAREILRGASARPADLLPLALSLKRDRYFGYARRILARARQDPASREDSALRQKLGQQHALCTYYDRDLPEADRLDRALEILKEIDDLATTRVQETLGIAGAIFKREWQVDGQKRHLERSLAYYRRGYEQGIGPPDNGYNAINAAFVLDLIADMEAKEAELAGTTSASAEARSAEAHRIRVEVVEQLAALAQQPGHERLGRDWWFLVTVAEAHFGLKQYDEAQFWLREAASLGDTVDWQYETTARQLAALARLHDPRPVDELDESRVWTVLRTFLRNDLDAVRSSFIGKTGLALSGGGFRASFFHIGTLAQLAEQDALRHVEVLSCVSGGSIVGAQYYLEVRKLLQSRRDAEITRDDYIQIVKRLEEHFLAGVRKNIRMRVLSHWWSNVRMIFTRDYSRTLRVGELYEKFLFSSVKDGEQDRDRYLNQLFIQPVDGPEKFSPKAHNWRRRNKVPVLILNAASLNTGHNWQFTASWMGESPVRTDPEIDGNERLRRMYYEEAPPRHRQLRLGHAVAASSCVPGLFEPLVLEDLYPGRTVRLVDGGVHDNQGVDGLLEQDCTVMLVSDASGQMSGLLDPDPAPLDVLLRSNNILMSRVREAQYHELRARRRTRLLRGLMFIHLKKDLDADPVDWIDSQDPFEASDDARPAAARGPLTRYGMPREVQRRLAAIRTDLDIFTEAEAYALMLSGYRMAEHEVPRTVADLAQTNGESRRTEWKFLAMDPIVRGARDGDRLARLLDAASSRTFRMWKLSHVLKAAGFAFIALALGSIAWAAIGGMEEPSYTLTPAHGAWAIIGLLVAAVAGRALFRAIRYRRTFVSIGVGVVMAVVGWIVVRVHMELFDRLYWNWGRLDRFTRR